MFGQRLLLRRRLQLHGEPGDALGPEHLALERGQGHHRAAVLEEIEAPIDADDVVALVLHRHGVADTLVEDLGEGGAEHDRPGILGPDRAAGDDLQLVQLGAARPPAVDQDADVAVAALDVDQLQEARRDPSDARDPLDLGSDVLVEVASELIGDAGRDHDQVDPAALEIGAEGPLEAVGHAPKRHHRADGHGDAEDRQQRSGLAPHQVFEQERCEVHQDASLESRRSAARCLRTSSTNRGPFCTGAMCLVPGTISTVQLGR